MSILKPVGDFFALDIGTTGVRVVKLAAQSKPGLWTLQNFGYSSVDPKISGSDSPEAQHRLGEVILSTIQQAGVKTRDVVVNLPSAKTFATVVDLPKMTPQELKINVRYEAEQFIPMPIDEVQLDYALLGDSPTDPEKLEVLLMSVASSYNEARLDMVESLGLNVVAMEPDATAMLRAVLPAAPQGSALVLDVGDFATDLIVTKEGTPRLIRSIPLGLQSLIKTAAQNLSIDQNQAAQFILKFGLATDRLEGQIPKAVDGTMEQFVSEVNKSMNFFQNRYTAAPVTEIVVAGYGATIPMFSEYIAQKTSLKARNAQAWGSVVVSEAQKTALAPIAAQFGVAIGLAQRKEMI